MTRGPREKTLRLLRPQRFYNTPLCHVIRFLGSSSRDHSQSSIQQGSSRLMDARNPLLRLVHSKQRNVTHRPTSIRQRTNRYLEGYLPHVRPTGCFQDYGNTTSAWVASLERLPRICEGPYTRTNMEARTCGSSKDLSTVVLFPDPPSSEACTPRHGPEGRNPSPAAWCFSPMVSQPFPTVSHVGGTLNATIPALAEAPFLIRGSPHIILNIYKYVPYILRSLQTPSECGM